MEKFYEFFERKCYDVERTKSLYLSAREQFLKQAQGIMEGDNFFMGSVAHKAEEMNAAFKEYYENYRTSRQFAAQMDAAHIGYTDNVCFMDKFEEICGKEAITKEPEKEPEREDVEAER